MSKLLVVVDYQNDFVEGTLGFAAASAIDAGIAARVQAYLATGEQVLVTYDTHTENYLQTREGRALPVMHCVKDTVGWQLYGQTQQAVAMTCCSAQVHMLEKNSFGMSPKSLIQLAQNLGEITAIEIVGVVTNICVISNAVLLQAQWPQAQITVDAALCAGFDEALHEKALDVMEGLQMQVVHRKPR